MLAMLIRLFTSRRSTISLQLLRHYSIKVSSLKKNSLYAQILRRGLSPKAAPKGGLFGDGGGLKAIQPQASFRSVDKQTPPPGFVKLSELENGKHQHAGEDSFSDGSVGSKAESKEPHCNDGLPSPALTEGHSTVVCSDGDMLGVKHSVGDDHEDIAQILQSEGHHRHADGRRRRTPKLDCYIPNDKSMEIRPARVGHFVKSASAAFDARDEGHKLINHTVCSTERNAEDEKILPCQEIFVQNVRIILKWSKLALSSTTETGSQAKQRRERYTSSLVTLTSYQVKQKRKLFANSQEVIVRQELTKEFRQNLEQKIRLLHSVSIPPICVIALLRRPPFLSASLGKFAALLEVLTEFFGSSEMACDTLVRNPRLFRRPLRQLQLKLEVLDKFQVDRETCYVVAGIRTEMMEMDVQNFETVLIFLKELGLSVEMRNSMIRQYPRILREPVEEIMRPTVDFLKSLRVSKESLLKLLAALPSLLSSPLERVLLPRHRFFKMQGLSDETFVLSLKLCGFPDVNKFIGQYRFLREQGFSEEAISEMARKDVKILTRSPEAVKSIMEYLLHSAKRDISEVVAFPTCLRYNLTTRIIPRMKFLEELHLPSQYSLWKILTPNDSSFLQFFKRQS